MFQHSIIFPKIGVQKKHLRKPPTKKTLKNCEWIAELPIFGQENQLMPCSLFSRQAHLLRHVGGPCLRKGKGPTGENPKKQAACCCHKCWDLSIIDAHERFKLGFCCLFNIHLLKIFERIRNASDKEKTSSVLVRLEQKKIGYLNIWLLPSAPTTGWSPQHAVWSIMSGLPRLENGLMQQTCLWTKTCCPQVSKSLSTWSTST